ncbi:MAG: hypothetical protein D6763_09135 [Alphaproteobacteria bacterium]|nr:MAG: hypothetical protein D6763_09135 [Alphaproteobacteria bacterium]
MTDDVPALDPAQARMQRVLKLVVVSLGVLILVILGIIVATVLARVGDMSDDASTVAAVTHPQVMPSPGTVALPLPPGAAVEHMAVGGGVLVLHVRSSAGDGQILLVDLSDGAIRGRFELTAP